MKFHILNRLAEINQRVGPILDELGVKAKIARDTDGSIYVEFKNKDGTRLSPVEIYLGNEALSTTTPSSWRGSQLEATYWDETKIGDNGWTLQHFANSSHSYKNTANADHFLDTLAKWLRGHGVIYSERSKQGYTVDEDFARAYKVIKDALPHGKVIKVNCERGQETDAYVFTHPTGHDWRVTVINRSATAYVDGVELASVYVEEMERKLGPIIYAHARALSADRGLKR
jgi:hypothetical protein